MTGSGPRDAAMRGVEAQVFLKTPFPEGQRFQTENFRLYCTPIVNLFPASCSIPVKRWQTEYQVVPEKPEHMEVYSVRGVEGTLSTGERRTYVPFYSFRLDRYIKQHRYYHITTRPRLKKNTGVSGEQTFGGLDTFLSLFEVGVEDGKVKETLSVSLICTNGTWPVRLERGDINQPTSQMPAADRIHFSNLTQPTLPLYPPLIEGYEWRILSHFAFNYLSLTRPEVLRNILELYEWNAEGSAAKNANRHRMTGIIGVHPKPLNHVYRGAVIRGVEVKLEIDEAHFDNRAGDLHLFGLVMKEFLALYASINSFVALKLVRPKTNESEEEVLFEWPPEEVVDDKNRESLMTMRRLPL